MDSWLDMYLYGYIFVYKHVSYIKISKVDEKRKNLKKYKVIGCFSNYLYV